MAKCNHCSAPLAANSNKCVYCGTRNDVDFQGKSDFSITGQESPLLCPHCEKLLQTIKLEQGEDFQIERCASCFGLFFGPGKIEMLLEKAVGSTFRINLQQLDNVNLDRFQASREIKYVKCPVCRTYMNRNVFAYRSGVIVDRCTSHGVWLDSGEITHLMEWKKAGGQLLHEQQKFSGNNNGIKSRPAGGDLNNESGYSGASIDVELLDTVVSVLEKFFE